MIDYPCFRQPIIPEYPLIPNELRGFVPYKSDRLIGCENKKHIIGGTACSRTTQVAI